MNDLILRLIALLTAIACSSAYAWDAKEFKKPSLSELKQTLSSEQFDVTQKDDTEKAFKNKYWDNKQEGLYVDIVSGEPLFSSKEKFHSGTGWPSFYKPLVSKNIVEKEDKGLFSTRTEVRSRHAGSHLGHVFNDGPQPTGLRYCLNSAALRFIPKEKLKEEGYGEFLNHFESTSLQRAVFAGGCFWCMQPPFDKLKAKGVVGTVVGYTGGSLENPTYKQVSSDETGHFEAIEVSFDPEKISYLDLLKVYFKNIDPYDDKGQFCDKGSSYLSAVFYVNENQKKTYEEYVAQLKKEKKLKAKITTQLLSAKKFYPAEEYHQSYYLKNPLKYKYYRFRCGRDDRLNEIWKD